MPNPSTFYPCTTVLLVHNSAEVHEVMQTTKVTKPDTDRITDLKLGVQPKVTNGQTYASLIE